MAVSLSTGARIRLKVAKPDSRRLQSQIFVFHIERRPLLLSALSPSPYSSCCLSYGLDPFRASEERFSRLKKLNPGTTLSPLLLVHSLKQTHSLVGEAQIKKDAEIALKVQAELDEEARLERQGQEHASLNYIANLYDEVQARIDADHELAVRWTQKEQEKYTVDERAKLVAEYFKNRKNQLAEERAVLYIKEQERIVDFVPIGSERDEGMIEKMNNKAAGVHEEKVLEEPDSTKVEVKQEGNKESTRKRPGRRLKMKVTKKSRMQKTDSDLEEEEHLKTFLKQVPDKEGIIDYEVLEKRFSIISWESKFYHLDRHGAECIYYRIFRSDESSRWIKTFSEMVTMFDRLDLEDLYNLVMHRFESSTPEGVDLVLWGDLKTIFDANAEDDIWKNQEEWILRSWNFYENCGVHTLILEDGTKIHMLAERKYPLTKETLERMMSLKLIAKSASESAYNLLRFIQKQIDEYGSYDGREKDI
ncbi:hypothetical protein Tco_0116611 [Tanacetum coccineum]